MIKRTVRILPLGIDIECSEEETILQAALRLNLDIGQQCGGSGTCGKCRIRTISGSFTDPTDREKNTLTSSQDDSSIRLACQTRPLSDCSVHIIGYIDYQPEGQSFVTLYPMETDSRYRSVHISADVPSITDVRDDASRVIQAVEESLQTEKEKITIGTEVIASLPDSARKFGWSFYVTLCKNEIVSITEAESDRYGAAIDMGSTKLAAYLVDLDTGAVIGAAGRDNPQSRYGSDIITRLAFAVQSEENRKTLQHLLREAVQDLIVMVCGNHDVRQDVILEVTLVGNTAMHHLFLGLPVSQLVNAPYVPACSDALYLKAREAGLSLAPGARCFMLPNIAGFVGADHMGMLFGMEQIITRDNNILLMDVGTNTEICLSTAGAMKSVSTPSGPAFEGGQITCGMRASKGAVDTVSIRDGRIDFTVIGGGNPTGICGSGIIDLISELYTQGILDWRGRFGNHPLVRSSADGTRIFLSENVFITQNDIQEFMLAKGAVAAGVTVLLEESGVSLEEIDQVIIAGAFGAHIDVKKAIAIGLFPDVPMDRFLQAGNAAGAGAVRTLLSTQLQERVSAMQHEIHYLELAAEPRFKEVFPGLAFFPRNR